MESRLRRELDDVLEQKEMLWYQKSRLDFIKDGDRNTKFFQVSTLIRRWQNKIESLKNNDGVCIHDKEAVKELVVTYFQSLYSEEGIEDADAALIAMPLGLFQELRSADFHKLGSAYTQNEIELALFDMKAPGLDDFQALF